MCKLTILFIHIKHAIVEMYLSVQCCCCTVHSTVTALSYKSTREEWNKCNKCYKFFNNKRQLNEKKWNEMKRNANKRKEKKRKPPWKKNKHERKKRPANKRAVKKWVSVCANSGYNENFKMGLFLCIDKDDKIARAKRKRTPMFIRANGVRCCWILQPPPLPLPMLSLLLLSTSEFFK